MVSYLCHSIGVGSGGGATRPSFKLGGGGGGHCPPPSPGICNRWTGELDWSTGLEHWTGVLEHWSTLLIGSGEEGYWLFSM